MASIDIADLKELVAESSRQVESKEDLLDLLSEIEQQITEGEAMFESENHG